jgi:integrase/recombinase XerD
MRNSLQLIRIEPTMHRGEKRLKLIFDYDKGLIAKIRKIDDCRWSATMKCWHVPDNNISKSYLNEDTFIKLERKTEDDEPDNIKTIIDIDEYNQQIFLKFPFNEKIKNTIKKLTGAWWHKGIKQWSVHYNDDNLERLKEIFDIHETPFLVKRTKPLYVRKVYARKPVSYDNVPDRFINELRLQNRSENTIKNYRAAVASFLDYFKGKEPQEIPLKEIRAYILHYRFEKNYSPAFQNQVISALKVFYRIIYSIELGDKYLPRPKKSRKLPRVISQEEVEALIKQTRNQKHKLILMLMYGAGLRVGEIINLKVEDIDMNRKQLNILNGKGRKDRSVNLTPILSKYLDTYIKDFAPRIMLFSGQGNIRYSRESIAKITKRAAQKAGIRKKVTPHVLRHCYATHMLEKGVDLRYIQYLLGHKSSRTTEIYTHVSTKMISELGSPIDDIEL